MTEQRIPAVEIWNGTATPAEHAAFDQATASARDDLTALEAHFQGALHALGDAQRQKLIARYVLGLYEWDPLHLAMALTMALSRLEEVRGRRA